MGCRWMLPCYALPLAHVACLHVHVHAGQGHFAVHAEQRHAVRPSCSHLASFWWAPEQPGALQLELWIACLQLTNAFACNLQHLCVHLLAACMPSWAHLAASCRGPSSPGLSSCMFASYRKRWHLHTICSIHLPAVCSSSSMQSLGA